MRIAIQYRVLLLLIFSTCATVSYSQNTVQAEARTDRNSILIGERILLTLEADIPETQPIRFFFIDSFDHFEILEKQKIDTINTATGTRLQQQITLTSFDSGQWVIPPLFLDREMNLGTDSIIINVGYTAFDPAQPYHDISDIIEVEPESEDEHYWYYVIGGAILLVLLLIYFLTRKKKEKPAFIPAVNPFEEAMQKLEGLKKQKLPAKEYYSRLTDIFRNYLDQRKNIRSLQRTTSDLAMQLRSLQMENDHYKKLSQALQLSDFVKFAKYQPSDEDDKDVFEIIKHCIQTIENMPG